MTSEYVGEVEVNGFAVAGTVAVDGSLLTAKQARVANDDKLAGLAEVDSLVREDGTGILWFVWTPGPDEGGADTWHAAKLHTEDVLSRVAGAGFAAFEHRIVIRDRDEQGAASTPPADGPSASPDEETSEADGAA
mgnify:CR=1 FL=1